MSSTIVAALSGRGAVIRAWQLLKPRYVREAKDGSTTPIDIVTRAPGGALLTHMDLSVRWKGGSLPADLEYEVEKQGADNATFMAPVRRATDGQGR